MVKLEYILLCFVCFFAQTGHAAENLNNARAFALGGAYSCLARGAESALWNPANLSYHSKNQTSVSIMGVGVYAYNNAFSNRHYARYNGAYLDQAAKIDILNIIPGDGLHLNIRGDAQTVGVAYGPVALCFQGRAAGDGLLDKDLFDLAFNGNQMDRLYTLEPATGGAQAFENLLFSYGQHIPLDSDYISHLGVGATLKYVRGEACFQILNSRARTLTQFASAEASGSATLQTASGGYGMGLDVGATMVINKKIHLALSIDNVVSTVRWNNNPQQSRFTFDMFTPDVEDLLIDSGAADSIFVSEDSTFDIRAFDTSLPQTIRLGAMHKIKSFVLAAEVYQGLAKTDFTSALPRLSLGCEYTPAAWLRLRLGQSAGGEQLYMFSYGFGLVFGPFRWDFAGRSIRGLPIGASKGIGAATSMALFF